MMILLLVCVAQMVAMPLHGQWSVTPDVSEREEFPLRLLQALDLSPEQQDTLRQLREILQQDILVLGDLVAAGDILSEEGRWRYGEVIDMYRVSLDSVLTLEQVQLLARARSHLFDGALYQGQPKPDVPQRLADALELNDMQRRHWLALLARQRDHVRRLRAEGELVSTRDYRRLLEEFRFAFEGILTPQQRLELERVRLARVRREEVLDAAQMDLLNEFPTPIGDDWESLESELGGTDTDP
jgi:hypothetical protein